MHCLHLDFLPGCLPACACLGASPAAGCGSDSAWVLGAPAACCLLLCAACLPACRLLVHWVDACLGGYLTAGPGSTSACLLVSAAAYCSGFYTWSFYRSTTWRYQVIRIYLPGCLPAISGGIPPLGLFLPACLPGGAVSPANMECLGYLRFCLRLLPLHRRITWVRSACLRISPLISAWVTTDYRNTCLPHCCLFGCSAACYTCHLSTTWVGLVCTCLGVLPGGSPLPPGYLRSFYRVCLPPVHCRCDTACLELPAEHITDITVSCLPFYLPSFCRSVLPLPPPGCHRYHHRATTTLDFCYRWVRPAVLPRNLPAALPAYHLHCTCLGTAVTCLPACLGSAAPAVTCLGTLFWNSLRFCHCIPPPAHRLWIFCSPAFSHILSLWISHGSGFCLVLCLDSAFSACFLYRIFTCAWVSPPYGLPARFCWVLIITRFSYCLLPAYTIYSFSMDFLFCFCLILSCSAILSILLFCGTRAQVFPAWVPAVLGLPACLPWNTIWVCLRFCRSGCMGTTLNRWIIDAWIAACLP